MIRIPTTNELYLSIKGDLEASESITIPIFGKSVIRVFAAVQAAKIKLLYLTLGNLQKNIFIDTAQPEAQGGTLERFGRVKLGRDPFPPQAAQYSVTVTGTPGAVIPASYTFKSDDTSLNPGVLFILDIAYTMVTTSDNITIRALTAGLDSKLNVLDTLTGTAPLANVDKITTVASEVVAPLAAEDIELYRQKGLNSYRLEAQGGAPSDYRLWSADAQGVQQVYPYAKSGFASEINLYIEATPEDSEDGKGTPGAAIIAAVEEVVNRNPDITLSLNERGRRPATAIVNYEPITVKEINIEIVSYVGNTAAITASNLSGLTDMVNAIRPFVAAADVASEKNDILDNNRIIATLISIRPGAVFTGVNLYVDGVLSSTWTFENGDIPYLNSVTYI